MITQLPQAFVHQADLPLELAPDVAAGKLAGSVNRQTGLEVLEAEAEGLEPPDEALAPQAFLREQPEATGAAAHRREQYEVFVVPEGLHRQATATGQLADLHPGGRGGGRHGGDGRESWRLSRSGSYRLLLPAPLSRRCR